MLEYDLKKTEIAISKHLRTVARAVAAYQGRPQRF